VTYQQQLVQARDALVSALEALPAAVLALSDDEVQSLDDSTRSLLRLYPRLTRLRVLEVAAVVSPNHNDPESWRQWSDKEKQQALIERFKRRWAPEKTTKTDPLAILVVNNMLLTGFDAPV
jgi:type I restriction enzyme R subunit